MCGIIGAVSKRDLSKLLLAGLYKLEYRGYDSAGIAVINKHSQLERLRVTGKVQALADVMQTTPIAGCTGIAHTRWATHGKPCDQNTHPHMSNNELAIVHNGIIENYETLRQTLLALGYEFTSDTDTEIAAHLIHHLYQQSQSLLTAVQSAATQMQGAFALGIIHKEHPHELIAIRRGSPLIIGFGIDENFIASDIVALRAFSNKVIYLQDGESARITANSVECFDSNNQVIKHTAEAIEPDESANTKGSYRHFMLKEIFEQPQVLIDTLSGRAHNINTIKASFGANAVSIFAKISQIHIVACGTSYHAGLIAKSWLESLTNLPTQVDIASEYRYRDVVVPPNTLFITISQSGETADTIAALCKAKSITSYLATLTVCNIPTSTLVRESDLAFLTRAGVEIGVASTKAFTTQLAALLMLSIALCHDQRAEEALEQLQQLPTYCEQTLHIAKAIEQLSAAFVNKAHALFLGRGAQYPVAMEGALKLKEISYIHAEAYPAGELKHGPLALVDNNMPVIAIAPNDDLLDKLHSNLNQVSARGGQLFVFIDEANTWAVDNCTTLIKVPSCGHWIAPIVYTIPLQLLAYYVAVAKGTDVDQPRNLAKSVTVE